MAVQPRRHVDINTPSASQIKHACGMDGVLARRIAAFPEEHGVFETREDIDAVPGFAEVLTVAELPSRRRSGRGSQKTADATHRRRLRRDESRGASRGRGVSRTTEPTANDEFIRNWVKQRGGWPACVSATGGGSDIGMLRIDFPGFTGEDLLERIDWDTWFKEFDDSQLAFLHREMRHSGGQLDGFNKPIKRNGGASR